MTNQSLLDKAKEQHQARSVRVLKALKGEAYNDAPPEHFMLALSELAAIWREEATAWMTPDDKVFDAFYHITTLNYNHPYFGMPSEFWGIYENNDRDGRLLAMINYNNDISEYWEGDGYEFQILRGGNWETLASVPRDPVSKRGRSNPVTFFNTLPPALKISPSCCRLASISCFSS